MYRRFSHFISIPPLFRCTRRSDFMKLMQNIDAVKQGESCCRGNRAIRRDAPPPTVVNCNSLVYVASCPVFDSEGFKHKMRCRCDAFLVQSWCNPFKKPCNQSVNHQFNLQWVQGQERLESEVESSHWSPNYWSQVRNKDRQGFMSEFELSFTNELRIERRQFTLWQP